MTVAAVKTRCSDRIHRRSATASQRRRINGFILTARSSHHGDDPRQLLKIWLRDRRTGITKAAKWSSTTLTKKDKRVCNSGTQTLSNSGDCALRFQASGILIASRSIRQTVKNPKRRKKGENYTLDASISAKNLTAGAKLIVQVKYGNGTKAKAVIKVPAGTYGYTPVSTVLPITRKVTWVRVNLVGGTTSGRLLIDDLVLWSAGTLPTATRRIVRTASCSPARAGRLPRQQLEESKKREAILCSLPTSLPAVRTQYMRPRTVKRPFSHTSTTSPPRQNGEGAGG